MAITEDLANTPTAIHATGTTATTATFTPSAGSLLVALVAADGTTTTTATVTDSVSGTWTLLKRQNTVAAGLGGTAEVWVRYLSSAPGTITVTASGWNANGGNLTVRVLLGAAQTQTGVTGGTGGASVAPTATLTPTQIGSWVFGALLDYTTNASFSATALATTALIDQFPDSTNGDTWLTFRGAAATSTLTSTTYGFTNASAAYNVAIAEILAAPSSPDPVWDHTQLRPPGMGSPAGSWNPFVGDSAPPTSNGTASLAGAGSLTAAASVTVPGTAALTGAGTLTASAGGTTSGTATITGAGSLTAAATVLVPGTATLAGAGSLTATAAVKVPGSGTLAGAGTLTASGAVIVPGTATLTGAGTLTASTGGSTSGTAALVGAGTLTAAAMVGRAGTASLAGAGTLSAAAVVRVPATATLTGSGSVTAAAAVRVLGTATLTSAGTLTAAAASQAPVVAGSMSPTARQVHSAGRAHRTTAAASASTRTGSTVTSAARTGPTMTGR